MLVAILVCVLFLCLVASFKPYRDAGDDRTNTVAYICLVMTLVLGMAIKVQSYERTGTEEADKALFTTLLIIVNVTLLAFALMQMVVDTIDSINQKRAQARAARRVASRQKEDREELDSAERYQ